MILFELLSRLYNSNTSLLFWNLFTGLKFLNDLNIKSSLSQNSQYHSATVSLWPRICSASSWSQHTLFTDVTLIKPSSSLSHSSLLPTSLTSSLEPASYIAQNSSSELFIPLSATFIWICRFYLLHTPVTFHQFFTVSFWAQNLHFQKIVSSTLVCFCLSDWSHGCRPFPVFICSSVLCFISISLCFSYSSRAVDGQLSG